MGVIEVLPVVKVLVLLVGAVLHAALMSSL
jgi:hypothetical protein